MIFSLRLLNTARFGYSRASFFFTGYTPINLSRLGQRQAHRAIVISGQHRIEWRIGNHAGRPERGQQQHHGTQSFHCRRSRFTVAWQEPD